MSFRFTCSVCHRQGWDNDNRNAKRKHHTHAGVCRRTWRTITQRERRARKRIARLEQKHVAEQFNLWHKPKVRPPWKKSHSSRYAQSRTANAPGKPTTSKAKQLAAKKTWAALSKPSRK